MRFKSTKQWSLSIPAAGIVLATSSMASAATVGYWQLDDAAPTTTASSIASEVNASALDGVALPYGTGAAPVHNADVPGLGITDGLGGAFINTNNTSSLNFTGSSGQNGGVVQINDNMTDDTLLDAGNFTLEVFAKNTGTQNFSTIFGRNHFTNSAGWGAGTYFRNNRIRIANNESPFAEHTAEDNTFPFFNGNGWHHLALTYDADTTTLSFYGDYQFVISLVQPIDYITNIGGDIDGSLVLGGLNGGNGFTGLIDELRFSDSVLTTDQFLRAVAEVPEIPVPEPASLALLGMGMLTLLKRNRA